MISNPSTAYPNQPATGPRTVVTLAVGPDQYLRMALALMESCHRVAGDRLEYIIFSDVVDLSRCPYVIPPWLKIERLQGEYNLGIREENFGLKKLIFRQPILRDRPTLFLDADTWVYANRFDEIFAELEKRSVLIFGEYLEEGALWQTVNFQEKAALAGFEVRNMSLNSGLLARQPDALGHTFTELFFELMSARPLAPFMATTFLKFVDEPYVAIAYQLAHRQHGRALPEIATPLRPADYLSTYRGFLTEQRSGWPTVHKPEKGIVQPRPAMIHFFGTVDSHYYFQLQMGAISRTWRGWLAWPREWKSHLAHHFHLAIRRWKKRLRRRS